MPTPLHLKPPTAAWIVRERKRLGLKPADIASRLREMGYEVGEATVKVWESNADRRPSPDNLDGLARLFGSAPPDRVAAPAGDVAAAIDRQTTAMVAAMADQAAAVREQTSMLREAIQSGIVPGLLDWAEIQRQRLEAEATRPPRPTADHPPAPARTP